MSASPASPPRHLAASRQRERALAVAWAVASACLLALTAAMCLWNLGEGVVWNADESRHAVNAYEMLRAGDLLVGTYNGEVDYWNLKPPLSMWSIMASYLAFGFNAFALRLPSACAYLLTVVLLWLFAWRRFGRAEALATAGLALTCTYVWGWHFARSGDADALYVLLFSCSMLSLMLAEENHRWVFASGLFVGLAFLAKASHALLLLPLILLCLLATRTLRSYRAHEVVGFFACALAPVALWAVARASRDGLSFFSAMLGVDVVERVSGAQEGNAGSPLMYARLLLTEFGALACVLSALSAGALGLVVRRLGIGEAPDAPRARAVWCLALWTALPVAAFSLVPTKLIWYVYPSLPALFMLGGVGLVWLLRLARSHARALSPLAALGAVLCVALAGVGLSQSLGIAIGGRMLGRSGVWTPEDVCGDAALQPAVVSAAEEGTLPYGAPAFVDYGDSTELDLTITGHGLRQGTFAVLEWYADARAESGGIPAFLAHEGPAILLVTSDVLEARADELAGCAVVAEVEGYAIVTHS